MIPPTRHIFWTPWNTPGLEHLALTLTPDGLHADGLVIGTDETGQPFRLHYRIQCDAQERMRQAELHLLGTANALHLCTDGAGAWTDEHGTSVPTLAGCFEVDIMATPFTNTLVIRRLGLTPGAMVELDVAYIMVPALTCEPMRQRYTCLSADASGSRYRYEGPLNSFMAELPVDSDGVVGTYPGLFRRQ